MPKLWIKSVVEFCTGWPWVVLGAALVLGASSGVYATRNFAISTDIEKLLSPELPWRQRELAFGKAFPQRLESIIAVVDAATPEFATEAALATRASADVDAVRLDHATIPYWTAFLVSPTWAAIIASTQDDSDESPVVRAVETWLIANSQDLIPG